MNNIDIFSSVGKPQNGTFFSFKNVGDAIQGTYIDVRNAIDGFGNPQTIYVLKDAEGKIWNLGFRSTAVIVHERMNTITFGQIVGFRFDEHRESKVRPGAKVKIIRIYADPKMIDNEWLEQQKQKEANFNRINPTPTTQPLSTDNKSDLDEMVEEFKVPEDAKSSNVVLPKDNNVDVKPKNDAIDAIRTLAKTKGLTTDAMTEAEADHTIEQYAGLPLSEENLTKIIISLTGYVSK